MTIKADVIGEHRDEVLLDLMWLLQPFGIEHYFTDGWGGYDRHISSSHFNWEGKYSKNRAKTPNLKNKDQEACA